ncbi:MAG TPA: polysaccharide deacetylase family protein [Solirubrobacterales bacterium]|nr:polysaccharide deacetylase family protein [Solirubrobacterales bacterium]
MAVLLLPGPASAQRDSAGQKPAAKGHGKGRGGGKAGKRCQRRGSKHGLRARRCVRKPAPKRPAPAPAPSSGPATTSGPGQTAPSVPTGNQDNPPPPLEPEREPPEEEEVQIENPDSEPFPVEEEPVATFPAGHEWTGNGVGSFSDAGPPFDLHNGRSFHIETEGDGEESIATSPPLEPVDLTESHVVFQSLVSFSDRLGEVRLRLSSGDIETDYAEALVWQEGLDPVILGTRFEPQSIPLGAFTVVGDVDWSDIDRAQIIVTDNGLGPVHLYVDGIYGVRDARRATISFAFDDGRESTFTLGAKKLAPFKMPASAYVISGAVDEPGYMSLEQLDTLRDKYHWEIGGHSATIAAHNLPNALDSLDPGELETEMDTLRDWLDEHEFPRRTFAYPKGAASPEVRHYVERDYCAGRVTARGPETIPPRNQYALRGWSVNNEETSTTDLIEAVNRAVAEKSWLILSFHDLTEGPPDDPNAIEYKEFSKIVNYVHTLRQQGTVQVQTIAGALGC